MINRLLDRVSWVLYRRLIIKHHNKGFLASPFSFAYKNCKFSEFNTLLSNTSLYNTTLGNYTYIAGAEISNTSIGAFSSIGPNVKIGGFGNHPVNWYSTNPIFYSLNSPQKISFSDKNYFNEFKPVVIGNDVWVGANVLVLDGIVIGDGAVIGAGSIVTKDVKPFEVVAGVPAKHLKFRFPKEEIEMIRQNPWWNKDISFYKKNAFIFRNNNVKDYLKILKKKNNY